MKLLRVGEKGNEKPAILDSNNVIRDLVKKYENKHIDVSIDKDLEINIRPNSIKRCLTNLMDNGLSYGKKLAIISNKTKKNLFIIIDDDGPRIAENEYQNVMKPFYRIDKSRGQNKSGVGLGLSIANDIVRSHGGNISLDKSPLSGLRVKISLPL